MSQYYNTPEEVSDIQGYINTINAVKGKPIVVQALWDGDTQGWFIYMQVIMNIAPKEQINPIYQVVDLCSMRFASDFRVFQGEAAWDEAVVAKNIGEALSKHYDIPIWFPSPIHPDDDCPSWLDRHKAIHCADCQKIIIPTDSPYLSKEVCYRCHLAREKKANFVNDKSFSESLRIYTLAHGADRLNFESYEEWLYTEVTKIGVYVRLKKMFQNQNLDISAINSYEMKLSELIVFRNIYEEELASLLTEYMQELPNIKAMRKQFLEEDRIQIIDYAGITYELDNFHHRELIRSIRMLKDLQEIIDTNKTLYLHFSRDKTTQLSDFFYFIRNTEQKTVQSVIKHFAELSLEEQKTRVALTEEQSRNVLQRLAAAGYVEIDAAENISITFKGMFY